VEVGENSEKPDYGDPPGWPMGRGPEATQI
jgi:hypothetical protein